MPIDSFLMMGMLSLKRMGLPLISPYRDDIVLIYNCGSYPGIGNPFYTSSNIFKYREYPFSFLVHLFQKV